MLDKTLISIISMVFGGVGLIGAVTKYEIPRARRTVYGQNLFLQKENIINGVVIYIFTAYAMIGLIIQIIFGEILVYEERIYNTNQYFIFLVFALILIGSFIPVMKKMSRWISRDYWLPEIAQKAKENFQLAKSLIDSTPTKATEIVNWLEELFEMKSNKVDLASRLNFFEKIFM